MQKEIEIPLLTRDHRLIDHDVKPEDVSAIPNEI